MKRLITRQWLKGQWLAAVLALALVACAGGLSESARSLPPGDAGDAARPETLVPPLVAPSQ